VQWPEPLATHEQLFGLARVVHHSARDSCDGVHSWVNGFEASQKRFCHIDRRQLFLAD
jgi:hypothetical protein